MSKFIDGMIECPFYLKEGERFIACEGILSGAHCCHKFDNETEKMTKTPESLTVVHLL